MGIYRDVNLFSHVLMVSAKELLAEIPPSLEHLLETCIKTHSKDDHVLTTLDIETLILNFLFTFKQTRQSQGML